MSATLAAFIVASGLIQPVVAGENDGGSAGEKKVDFGRQIRPILSANCFQCHGPDESSRQAELRLDRADTAYESFAIVPGKPDESELIARITADDAEVRMPPAEANKSLTREQIELLRQWIADGAGYEQHWAFVAPQRQPVPPVKQQGWARNPIDRFVLARLEQAGLQPSPPADRYKLVRRVYLDLIGLPPTPEEADQFVHDKSPDAYERLVDRLLASPHYGERWARPWLDLARYSDTNGYEKDQRRIMWPYRDWVIDAINADMPFDRFTIEQIAGDMLPGATPDQRIATGFHRNTMINEEGGVDPMEYRFYEQVDRVGTTGTVWLGLSISCAQCHDHKYDPLLQKEFYQLMAFYDQADDREFDVPDEGVESRRRLIESQLAALEANLVEQFPVEGPEQENFGDGESHLQRTFQDWTEAESQRAADWSVVRPVKLESTLPILTVLDDGSVLASGDAHKSETFHVTGRTDARTLTAVRLELIPHESLPNHGPGRGTIAASVEQKGRFLLNDFSLAVDGDRVSLTDASQSYAHKNNVAANALDDDLQSGWANDGNQGSRVTAVFQLAQPITLSSNSELTFILHSEAFYPSGLGRFRLAVTSDESPVIAHGHPADIEAILARPAEQRSQDDVDRLTAYYVTVASELADEQKKIDELRKGMPRFTRTLVMQQRQPDHFRQTKRHHRGEFLQPKEVVQPDVIDLLHDLPEGEPAHRLALAHWLVARDNPLVARVTVNRDWAALFGRGIVRSVDDFGTQGELPTHPKLLDWLAVEFVDAGWSRKHMHRLIVTSATYRQSSRVDENRLERDPNNLLLARGPRFRVDAELVRDVVLQSSGLLHEKIGGPSVFPPQPAGVSENSYGVLEWKVSPGLDRYRRGLYTFNKRTAPYAMFHAFDAPSGEVCVARRVRSNTPLQALMMLNDEVLVEAARALATRVLADEGGDPASRASAVFRRCLTRPPDSRELEQLVTFYREQLERFRTGSLDAAAVAGVDAESAGNDVRELAVWTVVARALLNLDELITKD